jgi:hypothetical protein
MKWFVALLALTSAHAQNTVSFNRDIRPIMADTCFRCHGPDASTRMAGLRLDLREAALQPNRAGKVPIVPGDPAKSHIIERIFHPSNARLMPPPYSHKELTAKQKETIRQWVAEGAVYEGHWSYQPLKSANPKASIDSFITARLQEAGLTPNPEADRRTLLRRVTLDLTGLPPKPADIQAFLNDPSPNAYEKVVDRLLASNAHAERLTTYWLDAVRYADTAGFHGDNLYPTWPYRDYILNSFRANKPFDVFTREQIAGDLLPNATIEQKVASAYNRLNRVSAEGGLQPKEYLAKYGADRVRTVSTVWLGATLGCAECHDHKFDPLLAKDFYSMKAFFADIKETGLVPDRGSKAWGSVMAMPTTAQAKALEEVNSRLDAAIAARQTFQNTTAAWEANLLAAYDAGKLAWKIQRPLAATSQNGSTVKIYNDEEVDMMPYFGGIIRQFRAKGNGLIVASGTNPDNETYTVTVQPGAGNWTALGLEVVQDESLPSNSVARGGDRLLISEIEARLNGKLIPITLATSNVSDPAYQQPPMAALDGDPNTGWGVVTYGENKNLLLALRLKQPLKTAATDKLVVTLRHDSEVRKATLGRFRIALSDAEFAWPEGTDITNDRPKRAKILQGPGGLPDDVLRALRTEPAKRSDAEKAALANYRAWADPAALATELKIAQLERERYYLNAAIPKVMISEAVEPAETRLLPRGDFLNETGPVVEPAIPQVFGKLDTGGKRATRLDLANWIVSKANPLTPRVTVNRYWRMFFGTGLSKSLDDLGSQGELPSHLDLLDTLAARFQSNWDTRALVKEIVMSHTYRQSSTPTKLALEKDPENRLLARQSRIRVDAEAVRDIALAASGLLTERFGGPSVRPYQPEGYLATLNFPKRDYAASRGQDLYARGLYTQWQRSFLHPSLLTFDAPTREECTVNRVNSNTPLQALVLLNDPTYVEASRVFAQNMLRQKGDFAQRLDWAFERALSRPATAEERTVLTDLYNKNLTRFRADLRAARQFLTVGDAPLSVNAKPEEVAAAATVTRAILNLHETITRN